MLEASDGVGGRLRTDLVQGFRLDRGFAVLFEAYPEARAQLDLQALDLRPFEPGADVYLGGGRMVTLADPLRAPAVIWRALRSGIWRPGDLPALLRWRRRARPRLEATEHEMTADRRLRDLGLSEPLRERFLRPLFAGEFFDHDLRLSSLLLDQAFLMMARGATSLPSEGMGAIAEQLAGRIPGGVRLGARVQRVFDGGVELAGGEPIAARDVVVATEPPEAARLTGADLPREPRSTTALWFASGRAPAGSRIVLDGTGEGPVTTVAAISEVAPSYAGGASRLRDLRRPPRGDHPRAPSESRVRSYADRFRRSGRRRLAPAAPRSHPLGAARSAARNAGAAARSKVGAGRPRRRGRRGERVDRRRAASRPPGGRGDPGLALPQCVREHAPLDLGVPGRIGAIWILPRLPRMRSVLRPGSVRAEPRQ